MRHVTAWTVALIALWCAGPALAREPQAAEAERTEQEREQDTDFRVYWRHGLRMETGDGRFQFRIGGRIQADWTFPGDSAPIEAIAGPLVNGNEFRRARLYVQGHVHRHVEFKAQYDFAGGEPTFKDVYLGTRSLPANARFGHFKEPFSLEEQTSSKYMTFLERSLANVFSPSRNTGIMVHGDAAGERVAYGVGLFRDSGDFGTGTGDDYNVTGRVTGTPVYEDDASRVVHLGLSLSFRSLDSASTLRFRQRPEVHMAPRLVDTGDLPADSATIAVAEAAVVAGPFSAQGELTRTAVDSAATGDPTFTGWYVESSWFLTGESRAYDAAGEFGRVSPRRDFLDGERGPGAWQLALRYSSLDLDDGAVLGGELDSLTVGANWHWNPMTRLGFNVVHADLEGVDDVTAFHTRAQIDF